MSILTEVIQRFYVILKQIPNGNMSFCGKIIKYPTIHMQCQGTLNSHNKLEIEQKWRTYLIAKHITKQKQLKLFYWRKGRYMEQLKQKRKSRNEPLHLRTNDF